MDESTSVGGPARPVSIPGVGPQPAAAADRRRFRVRTRWIHIGVGVFMGLAVLYGFDLANSTGRVPRGVEVAGIEVGGMRTADAEQRLISELGPRVDDPVDLRAGAVSTTLDPRSVGLAVDWQGTLDRAGEQSLNPLRRLISLVWDTEIGIASIIPDSRLTDFLEKLALQADFGPREGAVWFDRDQVRSVIPLDGQRLRIEGSRDAVLAHWLDDGGVDLAVDYTPSETDAEQVRALIRDVAEPAAGRDLTLLASRVRPDGTEPPVTTVATRMPAPPPAPGRERAEPAEREIEMVDPEGPDAVPIAFPRERVGEYLTFVRVGSVIEPRFDAVAAKGILEPLMAETEQEGRDATFSFSGSTARVVPAMRGRMIEWGPLLGALPGHLSDVDGERVLPVSYRGRDPELTTEQAEEAGIREPVGQFTVAVGASGAARSMIADLAGHFVPAGGSFSMTAVAGTAAGDVGADAVATALFNAAFEAGAQNLVRSPRGVDGEAFPDGRDATASEDVGFRNAQDTGLVIDASASGSAVTVRLWGTPEYDVRVSTAPRAEIERASTRVSTSEDCSPDPGRDGYTSRVTRVVQRAGRTVSTDTVSSTYAARDRVECRPAPTATPEDGPGTSTPSADPSPSRATAPGSPGSPSPREPAPAPAPPAIQIPGLPPLQIPGIAPPP